MKILMEQLLPYGIAMHHSGLLAPLRELVERLLGRFLKLEAFFLVSSFHRSAAQDAGIFKKFYSFIHPGYALRGFCCWSFVRRPVQWAWTCLQSLWPLLSPATV